MQFQDEDECAFTDSFLESPQWAPRLSQGKEPASSCSRSLTKVALTLKSVETSPSWCQHAADGAKSPATSSPGAPVLGHRTYSATELEDCQLTSWRSRSTTWHSRWPLFLIQVHVTITKIRNCRRLETRSRASLQPRHSQRTPWSLVSSCSLRIPGAVEDCEQELQEQRSPKPGVSLRSSEGFSPIASTCQRHTWQKAGMGCSAALSTVSQTQNGKGWPKRPSEASDMTGRSCFQALERTFGRPTADLRTRLSCKRPFKYERGFPNTLDIPCCMNNVFIACLNPTTGGGYWSYLENSCGKSAVRCSSCGCHWGRPRQWLPGEHSASRTIASQTDYQLKPGCNIFCPGFQGHVPKSVGNPATHEMSSRCRLSSARPLHWSAAISWPIVALRMQVNAEVAGA